MFGAALDPLFRAPTARQRRLTFLLVAATIAALAIAHESIEGRPIFPVDDAYITLHNAIVLDTGSDPSYRVPALVGATSCAHVLVVALFAKFFSPVWALEVVAWLGVLGYALGLTYLAFEVGGSVMIALGTSALGLTIGQTPHQLLNGLETGLALAATTWAVALAWRHDAGKASRYTLPALCGFLPFARPELAALSVLLLVTRWWRARSNMRVLARLAVHDCAIAFVAASPFLFAYWHSLGSLWPNTIAAKKYFFAEGCGPASEKLANVTSLVVDFARTLGIFSVAVIALGRSHVERACLAFVAIFLIAYYKEFPGALGHYEQRYMYVIVPLLLLGAAHAAASTGLWRKLGVFVLVAGLLETAEHFSERWSYHLATRAFTANELASVAEFVNANTHADDTILIHDAGYISYATSRHLVDVVGLKTPSNVRYHRDITWATCGRERKTAIADIAQAVRPQYLVALAGWDAIFGLSASLREHGWTVDTIRPAPAPYQVFRLTPPR